MIQYIKNGLREKSKQRTKMQSTGLTPEHQTKKNCKQKLMALQSEESRKMISSNNLQYSAEHEIKSQGI